MRPLLALSLAFLGKWPIAALVLAASASAPALAQSAAPTPSIAIAVDVKDSSAAIQGALVSAFRQLGGVVIVSRVERPNFILSGTVMCDPGCDDPDAYIVGLWLSSPPRPDLALYISHSILLDAGIDRLSTLDSATAFVSRNLGRFERPHTQLVAQWGRNRYEQEAREFARRLDTGCFERERMMRRAADLAPEDSAATNAILKEMRSRRWLC